MKSCAILFAHSRKWCRIARTFFNAVPTPNTKHVFHKPPRTCLSQPVETGANTPNIKGVTAMKMKLSHQPTNELAKRSDRLFTVDQRGTTTVYPFVVEWQIDRDINCEAIPLFEMHPPQSIENSFISAFDLKGNY
jgi:hypothetical protein